MIFIYFFYILASYIELYNNIQNTILEKYNKKDYIKLNKDDKITIITVSLDHHVTFISILHPYGVNYYRHHVEHVCDIYCNIIKEETIEKNVDYLLKLESNFKDEQIYYNITKNDLFEDEIDQLYNNLCEKMKKIYRGEKKVFFMSGFSDLQFEFSNEPINFVDIKFNDDEIYFQLKFESFNKSFFIEISGTEIDWNKYAVENISQNGCLNLKSKYLVNEIFKNFNFVRSYNFMNHVGLFYHSKNGNTNLDFSMLEEREKYINSIENFINFYLPSKQIYLTHEMNNEILQLSNWFINLTCDDVIDCFLLFNSLSNKVKTVIMNRIIESSPSSYNILIYFLLGEMSLISKKQSDYFIKLNLFSDTIFNCLAEKILIENDIDIQKLKNTILNYKMKMSNTSNLFFIAIFCKLLDKMYIEDDTNVEIYNWKKNYDDLFDYFKLEKKTGNLLTIFSKIIKDRELLLNTLLLRNDVTFCILNKLLNVKCVGGLYPRYCLKIANDKLDDILKKAELLPLDIHNELKLLLNFTS